MANLAIRGHATRGKEVVEILEMLGGKNIYNYGGERNMWYILEDYTISTDFDLNKEKGFTLEEFLEKYPYKVGDKVHIPEYESEVRICKMRWYGFGDIEYLVYRNDDGEWYTAENLKEYNADFLMDKENGETSDNNVYNVDDVDVISFDIAQKDIYQLDLKDNFLVILREGKYYVERIKPKYPKTYEECYNVLGYEPDEDEISCYNGELIESFVKLLICRDAYWKIVGEQMGLKEPWEPNWNNDKNKYCIMNYHNNILKGDFTSSNLILAFPTKEMRDIFLENFKDLIEKCKELL